MTGPSSHNAARHENRVAQITRLADRAELTELIFRVGQCLDEHRFEDLASLFIEDGVVVTPTGAARGHAALVEHATASNAQFDRMQHVTTNVLIDFEPERDDTPAPDPSTDADANVSITDHARIRANIIATFCQGADLHPIAVRGGVSRGKAVRTPDGWRLTELEASPTWAATK
jgi:SnoaL-like domain